jgi:hypothetical protein
VAQETVLIEYRDARMGTGPAHVPSLPSTGAIATDAVLLPAGFVAHAGDAGVLVQRESLSESQEQLSWRTSILMFRDQTLAEAAAEFNRYNDRKIVIRAPVVADLKVEGNFRAINVDAFPVRATKTDTEIVPPRGGNTCLASSIHVSSVSILACRSTQARAWLMASARRRTLSVWGLSDSVTRGRYSRDNHWQNMVGSVRSGA